MKKLIIFILIFVMCGFVFNKSIIKANTQVNNTLGYDSSFYTMKLTHINMIGKQKGKII